MTSGGAERALGGPPPTTHYTAGEAASRRQFDAHRRERTRRIARALHPVVIAAGILPAAIIIYQVFYGGLGANPIEEIQHRTGDWQLFSPTAAFLYDTTGMLSSWRSLEPRLVTE